MSYASIDGLESKAQEAHIEDSLKIQKLKLEANKNTTGICEDCEEKIPKARLAKVPKANCCVACQEERDTNPAIKITYKNTYVP